MKVERLERVAISVRNLDEAEKLFSNVLGIPFYRFGDRIAKGEIKSKTDITPHADKVFWRRKAKVSMSPIGIELMESIPALEAEGVRFFHFKVSNLQEAKDEMGKKGIRLVAEVELGCLKEAIYSPDDLHGTSLVLSEFETPSAIDAILTKK